MNDPILVDFGRAVGELADALTQKPTSKLAKAGCIQYFEFSFELAWKSIKHCSATEGTDCHSPKACLRQAFANQWIDDEELWLSMLDDRNRMTHTYDATEALKVFDRLAAYVPPLRALHARLVSQT